MIDEEMPLTLSSLQHFSFCRRQWALIFLENQWAENLRTTEGHLLHERAHDDRLTEKRGDVLISRGMAVCSHTLGVQGVCDVVEFRRNEAGVPLHGREGLWLPSPVEYKHGQPHSTHADEVQLCGQALCLEEMFCCDIPQGFLYYGELRRRVCIDLDDALRTQVKAMLAEMRSYWLRQHTPKAKPTKSCRACSLAGVCLPELERTSSAAAYLQNALAEEPT